MDKQLNINKDTYVYGILIVAILVFIIIGAFVSRPLYQDNKRQDEILKNRKEVTSTLENKKNKLEEYSKKVKDLKEQVAQVDKAVPQVEDRKIIGMQIFTIAEENGLFVESIDDNVTESTDLSEGVTDESSASSGVNQIRLNVATKGTYEGMVAFMDKIKTSLRLMNVEKVVITGSDITNLSISFTITAYTRGEITENEQL